jgi:anti-anti-sigma regulatory factor
LLRWCERLPSEKRVVILDLGDVTDIDDNAALELRALMQQFKTKGRRLVISGMNGEQYHAMVQAGAGDALDPTNVCPDLELAIARGLMFLDDGARRS